MAEIRLSNVSVDFPMYRMGSRSLKKTLLHAATGGRISREAGDHIVVNALTGINIDVEEGDRVAIIGANGAGKSTLLRVMAGTYEPTQGTVHIQGQIAALLDTSLGLNYDATGYENIMFRGLYMGLSPRQVSFYVDEIVEFTELGAYISMPLRAYSSGMLLRLAFGIATCIRPEILLMDEWLLAGDTHFIEKARGRMAGFVGHSKILVLASHLEGTIREWCTKALLLEAGRVKAFGRVDEVLDLYHKGQDCVTETVSDMPVVAPAEIVALVRTVSNDGVLAIDGSSASAAFSIAVTNVGVESMITVTPDTGDASLPLSLFICQTDPESGACATAPGASVILNIKAGSSLTFAVFANSTGPIPFNIARHRIFVRFCGPDGMLAGTASVAVHTNF